MLVLIAATLLIGSSGLTDGLSAAQKAAGKAKSVRDRVTDRATLKDGTHLWGLLVSEKPARILLRTAWLQTELPEFCEKTLQPKLKELEHADAKALAEELSKSIDALDDTNPDDRQRQSLLSEIRGRLLPNDDQPPEFVLLEIQKPALRNVETQSAQRREVCRLAILNRIPDYESTEWKSVVQQLEAIPVPARVTEQRSAAGDQQLDLSRILSAVDYQLKTATQVIVTGNQVIDESAEPDLSLLLNSLLGGNVQSLLGQLLDEGAKPPGLESAGDTLPAAAIQIAEKKGQSTLITSGFEFDLNSGTAAVSRRMYRKAASGTWTMLLSVRSSSEQEQIREGQTDTIRNDPQLQQISTLAEGLGLGGEPLANAIRMGAVVQNALQAANAEFDRQIQSFVNTRGLSLAANPPLVQLP